MNFDEKHVASLFDEMADEYDQLEDEWYPHLYSQIEKVIRGNFSDGRGLRALDVGCGTGIQTVLLCSLGYTTAGIDIAEQLVRQAQSKLSEHRNIPSLAIANALRLPFRDSTFDLVNCCGSTLSFIPNYCRALTEMARVLKKDGHLIIETEQRWNMDLIWGLLDGVTRGRLGYEQTFSEAWHNIFDSSSAGITISYPFTRLDGVVEYLPLRCFTLAEIRGAAEAVGLKVTESYGVHAVTNLIPSTWLHDANLRPLARRLTRFLARVDDRVKTTVPFSRLGCSMILILRKSPLKHEPPA